MATQSATGNAVPDVIHVQAGYPTRILGSFIRSRRSIFLFVLVAVCFIALFLGYRQYTKSQKELEQIKADFETTRQQLQQARKMLMSVMDDVSDEYSDEDMDLDESEMETETAKEPETQVKRKEQNTGQAQATERENLMKKLSTDMGAQMFPDMFGGSAGLMMMLSSQGQEHDDTERGAFIEELQEEETAPETINGNVAEKELDSQAVLETILESKVSSEAVKEVRRKAVRKQK